MIILLYSWLIHCRLFHQWLIENHHSSSSSSSMHALYQTWSSTAVTLCGIIDILAGSVLLTEPPTQHPDDYTHSWLTSTTLKRSSLTHDEQIHTHNPSITHWISVKSHSHKEGKKSFMILHFSFMVDEWGHMAQQRHKMQVFLQVEKKEREWRGSRAVHTPSLNPPAQTHNLKNLIKKNPPLHSSNLWLAHSESKPSLFNDSLWSVKSV